MKKEPERNKTTHDNDFSITILGSGTCVPSIERSSCAVLMEVGNKRLLFDSGAGTMHRLLEAGKSIFEIDHVFLSHFHPDHTGELVSFIFANKYPDGTRRKTSLTLAGGKGFKSFWSGLQGVYGRWIDLRPGLLRAIELDGPSQNSLDLGHVRLSFASVAHNPESLAYRVTNRDGRAAVYSGDTDVSQNLTELAKGADVLICESALPDELKANGHLTPSLAGETAALAGVKRLVLTHLYPECDQVDMVAQCRKTYGGPLLVAKDLMTLKI